MDNLTVVIPYRNGEATLTALLDSLPVELPVIVVDDQSAAPPRYVGRARQVRFIHLPKRGYFSGAVNAGISACDTDVLVLNQDVRLVGAEWQELIESKRSEYGIIGDGVMGHPAWPRGYVQGTFMFMRRDALNAVGLLSERDYPLWGATAEWQLRAARAGYNALPVSPVIGLEHARGKEPFGSAISAAIRSEPHERRLFIRTPPAISVIVTCHNYGRYLVDLVNSLLGGPTSLGEAKPQTFQAFEVIIVNDASTDETHEVGSALASPLKGVRYIHNRARAGTAEAINIGVRASFGKYITHICADDMMSAGRLEYLYRAAEANPGKVIYDDMSWFKGGKIFFRQVLPEYDFESLLPQNKIHTGIFYERSAWDIVGGYPAIMANGREDWAMNVRLGRAGFCGLRVNQAGYLYRREGQNRTMTNTGQDWHRFFAEKMHSLFPDIYAGERPEMCCGRPATKRQNGNGAQASARMAIMATSEAPPAGMVRVEYVGGNDGTQEYRGIISNRVYAFNASKRRFGYVDARDLETENARKPGLLQLRHVGRALFVRAPVEVKAEAKPEPKPEPVAIAPGDVPQGDAATTVGDTAFALPQALAPVTEAVTPALEGESETDSEPKPKSKRAARSGEPRGARKSKAKDD